MPYTPLSLTARTLYAELRESALAIGATEHMGQSPGAVVRKTIKGSDYLYYQHRDLDGHTRQAYLGPEDDGTNALIRRLERRGADREGDLQRLDELRGAFVAAGGAVMEHAPLRVIRAFADAGVLRPGRGFAVLVGTHAFNALGNLLGVRWASRVQTQDIDLAGDSDIDLAVSRPATPAPDVLEELGMGFIPVPTLDARQPSTSYRVRGREMRVDLLAPLVGRPGGGSVFVPALNAVAQPLRFLDYLLENPEPVVVVGRRHQVLVNVPAPERFALHKLLVSTARPAGFATKAEKDRLQALQLLEVLMEEAPDGVVDAKQVLVDRGKSWSDRMHRALKRAGDEYREVVAWVGAL